jgi:hypothetical protein
MTEWRKSSRSVNDVTCVEIAWRKSSRSADAGNCVEVAERPDAVLVRDSKLGDGSPVLEFARAAWDMFVVGVKAGEFE